MGAGLLAQLQYGLMPGGDGESFIVSPRRRLFLKSVGPIVVNPSSLNQGVISLPLADILNVDDGVQFEALVGTIVPGDALGFLSVTWIAIDLQDGGGREILPLGTPTPTTLVPSGPLAMQFYPPGVVLTRRDFEQWFGLEGFAAFSQPLRLSFAAAAFNNDSAGPHQFTLQLWCAYRYVQGLMGA
jgi:hypothetical protein